MASPAHPRQRRSFDWRKAARLMAAGTPASTIAAGMGINEDLFWRHVGRSARFRRFVLTAVRGIPDRPNHLVNLVSDRIEIDSNSVRVSSVGKSARPNC